MQRRAGHRRDDASGGALVVPQRLPGITVPLPHRPLRLLDLITVGQTDSDAVSYVEMTGFTNNAAETAEATAASGTSGTKPESALALASRRPRCARSRTGSPRRSARSPTPASCAP
jgi:hypothetical protein